MRAAGVRQFGGPVGALELPGRRRLKPDEVLIEVRACGVGNWDEFARTGEWDLGRRPPMALGVEAAGIVAAAGEQVRAVRVGDRVTAHSVPLREQGAWAEEHVVQAGHAALLPPGVSFDAAAALTVPALTADQAIDGLGVHAGQTVLVHGAGGVTGGLLVQLAVHRGATVIATAGADSADRAAALGASTVLDYRKRDWPERVRAMTGGGVDAAATPPARVRLMPCGRCGTAAGWPRSRPTCQALSGISPCVRCRSPRTAGGWATWYSSSVSACSPFP